MKAYAWVLGALLSTGCDPGASVGVDDAEVGDAVGGSAGDAAVEDAEARDADIGEAVEDAEVSDADIGEAVEAAAVDEIHTLLDSLPNWRDTFVWFEPNAPFGPDEVAIYLEVARALVPYSIDEIAAGFEAAIDAEFPVPLTHARANGFVLIRLMFDVPAEYEWSLVEVPNPFISAIIEDEDFGVTFLLSWPVLREGDRLAGIASMVGQNGGRHQLIDELRWFERAFARRAWVE